MNDIIYKYLQDEWKINNSPKYQKYFDEWVINLTDNQIYYYKKNCYKKMGIEFNESEHQTSKDK